MGEPERNTETANKSGRGFPVAKSVRGKLVVIGSVLLVATGFSLLSSSDRERRLARDAEVLSLMEGYSADAVSIYEGGWSGSDGSVPGRYTLHVTVNGTVHSCRQVSVEFLRDGEPVKCDGGAVIRPRG